MRLLLSRFFILLRRLFLLLFLFNALFVSVYYTQLDQTYEQLENDVTIELISNGSPLRGTVGSASKCPIAVRKNVGIFDQSSESSVKDNFRDVILLVSSNSAYIDFLQNWEYLAKDLQLQWAVLALDEKLYNYLGEERAISPLSEYSVTGAHEFRKDGFNVLTCNKMRMVLSIVDNCDVDVLFTDVDNVFYQNPLEHDLGRLIQLGRYDYIYQSNSRWSPDKPRGDQCLASGRAMHENNTGFYFMKRNNKFLREVMDSTLRRCEEAGNKFDDQKLFWQEIWNVQSRENRTLHHCNLEEYENEEPTVSNSIPLKKSQEDVDFNFCCMDPYYYPVGYVMPPYSKDGSITFHANYAKGREAKIEKLQNSRSDRRGWNQSRIHPVEYEHV